ncbi:MAG: anthranilate synthase component I [Anaerolineae bacterium]|nr:anthranilate synthase component I [Anaerolineae bacterium]
MIFPAEPAASITPTREQAADLFEQGDLLPVYRTILADLETPVSVYLKLRQLGLPAFLLESVEGGAQIGRYSFLGVNPRGKIIIQNGEIHRYHNGDSSVVAIESGENPLDCIRQELERFQPVKLEGLPRFIGGALGYIGYDIVRTFERLPATATTDLDLPDAIFLLVDTLVIFDHVKHHLILLANAHNTGDPTAAYDDALRRIDELTVAIDQPLPPVPRAGTPLAQSMQSNTPRERYEENVRRAKEYIAAGDAFQIVLSQRFSRKTSAPTLAIYRALRALNPSPYMFLFENLYGEGDTALSLVGASPEMMVRLEDGVGMVRPIAGTRHRGATESEDRRLADELLADPKERAEHVMLVDLGRNDLGRVCKYGSVHVPEMMVIERYSHVMHIVSQVEGRINDDMDAVDLFRATFPAGTLSGAPKIRAMEIIEELEGTRRGIYGGAVGYFSYDGSMDTCITIRAMVKQGDTVYVQAGAGLVADSDPAREYEETVNKAMALDVAIRHAEQGRL